MDANELSPVSVPLTVHDQTEQPLLKVQKRLKDLDILSRQPLKLGIIDNITSPVARIMARVREEMHEEVELPLHLDDHAEKGLDRIKEKLTDIIGLLGVGLSTEGLVFEPMKLAGEFERLTTATATWTGNLASAGDLMHQMQAMGGGIFNEQTMTGGAQQLLAIGYSVKDVTTLMHDAGEASAALGAGDAGVNTMVESFTQMRNEVILSGRELTTLDRLGIQASQTLADKYAHGSLIQLRALISTGYFPAQKALNDILDLIEGRYPHAMEDQESTFMGLLAQIKLTFNQKIFEEWGAGLDKGVKGSAQTLVAWMANHKDEITEWGDALNKAGESVGNFVGNGLTVITEALERLSSSPAFKSADLAGKFGMLWNETIIPAFDKWWKGGGEAATYNLGYQIMAEVLKGALAVSWNVTKTVVVHIVPKVFGGDAENAGDVGLGLTMAGVALAGLRAFPLTGWLARPLTDPFIAAGKLGVNKAAGGLWHRIFGGGGGAAEAASGAEAAGVARGGAAEGVASNAAARASAAARWAAGEAVSEAELLGTGAAASASVAAPGLGPRILGLLGSALRSSGGLASLGAALTPPGLEEGTFAFADEQRARRLRLMGSYNDMAGASSGVLGGAPGPLGNIIDTVFGGVRGALVPLETIVRTVISDFEKLHLAMTGQSDHITNPGSAAASSSSSGPSMSQPTIPSVPGGGGSTSSGPGNLPPNGDVAGWRAYLAARLPPALAQNSGFLTTLMAGAWGESGLNPNIPNGGTEGAHGLFQFYRGTPGHSGMGYGIPDSQLNDPNYELQRIYPSYWAAYQRSLQQYPSMNARDRAVWVALQAENPGDTPEHRAQYGAGYDAVTSHDTGGMLNERIIGVGVASGRPHQFAAGETVIPVGGRSGGVTLAAGAVQVNFGTAPSDERSARRFAEIVVDEIANVLGHGLEQTSAVTAPTR